MITPINIALLGVVLAAVALVILRRRHSGPTDETLSSEAADTTPAPVDEPAPTDEAEAPITPRKHEWAWAQAGAAATLAPVREDEDVAVADTDLDADDEAGVEDDALEMDDDALEMDDDALEMDDDTEDEAEDAEDLDAEGAYQNQDTGEIDEVELEAMTGPDDGLGDIITEPGWYLPGETDMTRGSPGAATGLLVPDDDLAIPGDEPEDELAADVASPAPLLEEGVDDFDATAAWASPAQNGAQAAAPTWLGLADEEGAAASAVPAEHEISFEATPTLSDDLFALPPLAEAFADEQNDELTPPPLSLDQWQNPVTPTPSFALGGSPADTTVAQHGPLTVSIDPAALLAIETEGIERSTSQGDGDVSWELTLKVQLRQRANTPSEAD